MFMEDFYNKIFEYYGNDKFKFSFYTNLSIYYFIAWTSMLLYSVMDYTKKPTFLYKYKIKGTTTVSMYINFNNDKFD